MSRAVAPTLCECDGGPKIRLSASEARYRARKAKDRGEDVMPYRCGGHWHLGHNSHHKKDRRKKR